MNSSKKRTNRKYDPSFKEDVIKLIATGRPISEISASLGVSASLLHRWYKASQAASSNSNSKGASSATVYSSSLEEIERLRTDLRRTEQERDILKKALGIFSRTI